MSDKKVYYMVFEKPISFKCWTRTDDFNVKSFGKTPCNIFLSFDSAEQTVEMLRDKAPFSFIDYCVFKCEEM